MISNQTCIVHCGDCLELISRVLPRPVDLTFLDPPFNQRKEYRNHNDAMPEEVYWEWMTRVCAEARARSSVGAALYFMQREKRTERVLRAVRESGWILQNLIIWKKKTSAVPGVNRFGKQYQIIAFATNGERPRVFNRLRIDLPVPAGYKQPRMNGVYITDIWDDIRELTAGYFSGDEAIRDAQGERFHKQQSPVHLLLRIILSSTKPGDLVLDPFAGTGTTLVTAKQLGRDALGIDIDKENVKTTNERLGEMRSADDIMRLATYYRYTEGLAEIWEHEPSYFKVEAYHPELTLQYEEDE